jgi:hypothetical protein
LGAADFAGGLAGTRGFAAGLASLAVGFDAVGFTFFRGDGSPFFCLVCLAMQFYSVLSRSRGLRTDGNPAPVREIGRIGQER